MRQYISCLGLLLLAACFAMLVARLRAPLEPPRRHPPAAASDLRNASLARPGAPAQTAAATDTPVIVVDPGHGGQDDGATGFDLKEKDLSLDIALRLEGLLRAHNLDPVLTRRTDIYLSLPDRVAFANQYEHSIFVSIHVNQSQEASATGVETYHAGVKVEPTFVWECANMSLVSPVQPDISQDLAASIQKSLTGTLPVSNRGVKARNLYVVCNVHNPAVLVECGFISNPADVMLLKNEDYRQLLASSIAEGIVRYEQTRKTGVVAMAAAGVKN